MGLFEMTDMTCSTSLWFVLFSGKRRGGDLDMPTLEVMTERTALRRFIPNFEDLCSRDSEITMITTR